MGDYLLSGSVDRTAVVWNVISGKPKQQFEFPSGVLFPLLDLSIFYLIDFVLFCIYSHCCFTTPFSCN